MIDSSIIRFHAAFNSHMQVTVVVEQSENSILKKLSGWFCLTRARGRHTDMLSRRTHYMADLARNPRVSHHLTIDITICNVTVIIMWREAI